MSEMDVLTELQFRVEILWNILQWWISISFAVMIAAYLGADKLTKPIVALIIIMYSYLTFNVAGSLSNHSGYVADAFETLQLLSESAQLSPIGSGSLERRAGSSGAAQTMFNFFAFLFTIGFVIYSYMFIRKTD